jgi:hypothetical protein
VVYRGQLAVDGAAPVGVSVDVGEDALTLTP